MVTVQRSQSDSNLLCEMDNNNRNISQTFYVEMSFHASKERKHNVSVSPWQQGGTLEGRP